jgi:hypothetical protein
MRHAGDNRILLDLNLCGRLVLQPGGRPQISAQVEAVGTLTLHEATLRVQNLSITRLKMSGSSILGQIVRVILNTIVIPLLAQRLLTHDLSEPLAEAQEQLNEVRRIDFELGEQKLAYQFAAGLDEITPQLNVTADGIRVTAAASFAPQVEEVTA